MFKELLLLVGFIHVVTCTVKLTVPERECSKLTGASKIYCMRMFQHENAAKARADAAPHRRFRYPLPLTAKNVQITIPGRVTPATAKNLQITLPGKVPRATAKNLEITIPRRVTPATAKNLQITLPGKVPRATAKNLEITIPRRVTPATARNLQITIPKI